MLRQLLLASAVGISAASAQVTPAQVFEVASVRLVDHPVTPHAVSLAISHDRLTIDAAALRQITGLAFSIQRVRVQGGPAWMDADLWDITAKAPSPEATRDDFRAMLQSLLAERFKLAVHLETRELPEYALVPWKDGPRLKPAGEEGKPSVSPSGTASGGRRIEFHKYSVNTLVNTLSNILGTPVIDKTGVPAGTYDYTLEWVDSQAASAGAEHPDSGPSLFVALQEQLGLKLEVKKVPTEVLLIDHVEKASAN